MHLKKDELTIIYNGDYYKSKQTLGFAKTITRKINYQDIQNTRVSMNLFCVILSKSDIRPKDLVNRADAYYQKELRNRNYTDEEWFYILRNNPSLLANPLVYYREKSRVIHTPTDVLKVA